MDFKNNDDLVKRYGIRAFSDAKFKSPPFSKSYKTLESEYEKYPSLFYKNPDNWESCPVCKTKPKVWEFNNGSLSKCYCYGYYSGGVIATDIGTYMSENNGSLLDYPSSELMDNWNDRCHELRIILKDIKS